MKNSEDTSEKKGFLEKYYWIIIAVLIAVSFVRPAVENINYPLLTTYDTWNFLTFAAQVKNNEGIVPNWDNLELYPEGRPFLYPPLVPFLLANASIISGISIFAIIKGLTFILYPILLIAFLFLASQFKNRKLTAIAGISFVAINQAFLMSINSLSQILELLLYIAIFILVYKKKYTWAIIPFGLSFWTHFITPFFFGAGLFIYGLYKKDERREIFRLVFAGLLIGSLWTARYAIFHDWMHPNLYMTEHTNFEGWFRAAGIEGFPFPVMFTVILAGFFLSKNLFRKVLDNRLMALLLATSIGMIPAWYYPERAVTYVAFATCIIFAYIILKTDIEKFKKICLLLIIPLLIVYSRARNSVLLLTFLILYAAFAAYILFSKIPEKKYLVIILFLLLFTSPATYQLAVPFISWGTYYHLGEKAYLPVAEYEACKFLSAYDPEAIVTTLGFRTSAACNYFGLRSADTVVCEFSTDGEDRHPENANYFIEIDRTKESYRITDSLVYLNISPEINYSIISFEHKEESRENKHLMVGLIGNTPPPSKKQEIVWRKDGIRIRRQTNVSDTKKIIYIYELSPSLDYAKIKINLLYDKPTYKVIDYNAWNYIDENEKINLSEVSGIALALGSGEGKTSAYIKDLKLNNESVEGYLESDGWNSRIGNMSVETRENSIRISEN